MIWSGYCVEFTYKFVNGENIKVSVAKEFESVMMQMEKDLITIIIKKLGDIKA